MAGMPGFNILKWCLDLRHKIRPFAGGVIHSTTQLAGYVWDRPKLAGLLSGSLVVVAGWWAANSAVPGGSEPDPVASVDSPATRPHPLSSAYPLAPTGQSADFDSADNANPVVTTTDLPPSRPVASPGETFRSTSEPTGSVIQTAAVSESQTLPVIVPNRQNPQQFRQQPAVSNHWPHAPQPGQFGQPHSDVTPAGHWQNRPATRSPQPITGATLLGTIETTY